MSVYLYRLKREGTNMYLYICYLYHTLYLVTMFLVFYNGGVLENVVIFVEKDYKKTTSKVI